MKISCLYLDICYFIPANLTFKGIQICTINPFVQSTLFALVVRVWCM